MPVGRDGSRSGPGNEVSGSLQWLHPGNAVLRRAIQENVVSFPSQVPVLSKPAHPDTQWRLVMLYLVRGWHTSDIGARYRIPAWRVSVIVHEWSVRAFASGCIQVIDGPRFEKLAGERSASEAVSTRVEPTEPVAAPVGPVVIGQAMAAKPHRPGSRERETGADASPDSRQDGFLDALDLAIQRCEGRTGAFWLETISTLRSLKGTLESMRLGSSHFRDESSGSSLEAVRGCAHVAAGKTRKSAGSNGGTA